MRKSYCRIWVGAAALTLWLFPIPGQSADTVRTANLTARLVAEQAVAVPGGTITVALHQEMAPGWHTYWRNPGDSGAAPTIDWQLPEGSTAAPLQWPAPHRIPLGPLMNFGYSDETALLSDIQVPPSWPVGTPFPIAAQAEILVCREICIPVDAAFSITVPTAVEATADPATRAVFATARADVPTPSPWPATARVTGQSLSVTFETGALKRTDIRDAYFFTDTWGVATYANPQTIDVRDGRLTVTMARGEIAPGDSVSGVLAVTGTEGTMRQSFAVNGAAIVPGAPPAPLPAVETLALPLLLALALAGGLLLNLMPCVFPVLAIKAFGLLHHGTVDPRRRIAYGLSYTAGVVTSFVALAALLLAARAGGAAVGWGFQLQNPFVVGALAYVAAGVGFSLSGLFEIGGRFAGIGGTWAARSGHAGSFATGVLAAVVAAPCTAPFMAAAAGGALFLPVPAALFVFAVMGLGLALPYLALSTTPALARRLPKPGPWMICFRQALAFPMYATAAWLIWVLAQQAGPDAAFLATLGLICLAAAAWLWPGGRRLQTAAMALSLAAAATLLWAAPTLTSAPDREQTSSTLAEPFTMARLDALRGDGRPVFLNMTAAWCITCKLNERVALSGDDFTATLTSARVAYLQGDWTSRNPEITAFLERFGRAGVPLYVFYPAGGGAPVVLPQILDPGALRRAIDSTT